MFLLFLLLGAYNTAAWMWAQEIPLLVSWRQSQLKEYEQAPHISLLQWLLSWKLFFFSRISEMKRSVKHTLESHGHSDSFTIYVVSPSSTCQIPVWTGVMLSGLSWNFRRANSCALCCSRRRYLPSSRPRSIWIVSVLRYICLQVLWVSDLYLSALFNVSHQRDQDLEKVVYPLVSFPCHDVVLQCLVKPFTEHRGVYTRFNSCKRSPLFSPTTPKCTDGFYYTG